ncbi:hypothetical protein BDP81DRAFT_410946 [Colletotrichum phormii]|uniref:Uncharacterized protein n=1 Tax=Colletotrichum phormii TaxID=359342 RepID=A0AAJ0E906_9PEZI|nr:uncharacterized protein BDP81DRAFT_410946 [Colletotrichum phormii]KAK1623131.1 hypothetical protein BDP81DRAFT_410946 [Colletotrichum phormii]
MTAGRPVVTGAKHTSVSPSTRPRATFKPKPQRTPRPVQLSNQRIGLGNIWGKMMAQILKT